MRPIYTERPSTQGTFKFQVNILFIVTFSLRHIRMFLYVLKAEVGKVVLLSLKICSHCIRLDKFVGMLLRGAFIHAWGSLFL